MYYYSDKKFLSEEVRKNSRTCSDAKTNQFSKGRSLEKDQSDDQLWFWTRISNRDVEKVLTLPI